MINTSSSFNCLMDRTGQFPTRAFIVGSDDFSDRVMKWPTVERDINDLKSVALNIRVSNHDGYFNDMYRTLYTGYKKNCYIGFGFGSETIPVYYGEIYTVRYPKEGECELKLRDKLWNLNKLKAGDYTATASFGDVKPSEIVWTLLTSYGSFCASASTGNADINYSFFNSWSAAFSVTPVRMAAQYKGATVAECVTEIVKLTDTQMWLDDENKLCFSALPDKNSINSSLAGGRAGKITPDVDAIRITTRLKANILYSPTSNAFGGTVTYQSTAHVNSWGVHETTYDSTKCWLTTSESAINIGGRLTYNHGEPKFTIIAEAGVRGYRFEMGNVTIVTNSFYGISSSDLWRVVGAKYQLEDGKVELKLEPSVKYSDAFYLDIHYLDGSEYLY